MHIKKLFNATTFKLTSLIKKTYKKESGLFYSNGRLNLGDSMTPWLIKKVCPTAKTSYSNPCMSSGKHLFAIGSILQFANEKSIIWGSGFISDKSKCKNRPIKVYALRGRLTQQRMQKLYNKEYDNVILGDPALLTSHYFPLKSKKSKKWKVGVIPHYADKKIALEIFSGEKNFKILDIETSDVEGFMEQISDCELILSSSLHGLIFSDSYRIPNVWIELSKNVAGEGFKFLDYFSSINRETRKPIVIDKSGILNLIFPELYQAIFEISEEQLIKKQKLLISSFPYNEGI